MIPDHQMQSKKVANLAKYKMTEANLVIQWLLDEGRQISRLVEN